jgi:serine O-acetyltransferase
VLNTGRSSVHRALTISPPLDTTPTPTMHRAEWIRFLINLPRFWPHLLVWKLSGSDEFTGDMDRWLAILPQPAARGIRSLQLLALLIRHPEFRNLFAYRHGRWGRLVCSLCSKEATLFIDTAQIGPGLFIQHGFATIITAKSVGRDCWINQQVTIGYASGKGCPTIGNHVTINAGAKVLGGITVGDHAVIGANAVVTKDVPAHATVVGVPGRVIRLHGQRVTDPPSSS